MLLLTRVIGKSIFIGDDIEVKVLKINQDTVTIGVQAPKNIDIKRDDIKNHHPKINGNF